MSFPLADLPSSAGALSALLLSIDPWALGGAVLDHPHHEHARWYATLVQQLLPRGAPMRRVPAGVTVDRLYGGVDLASTLAQGRLVAERGVLAGAHGGVVVVPMAERLSIAARTALTGVLDAGEVQMARDGLAERHEAHLCAVLIDDAVDDECVHPALRDRVAFHVVLDAAASEELQGLARAEVRGGWEQRARDARHRLTRVSVDEAWVGALCQTADAFGVDSVRAILFALRCARALAAWHGRLMVIEADAERAAALVLAPRATRMPAPPADPSEDDDGSAPEPPPHEPHQADAPPAAPPVQQDDTPDAPSEDESRAQPTPDTGELLREAVAAALPPGLLAQLLARGQSGTLAGRMGDETVNLMRGRPRGARGGLPRGGARLHLLETLRAAAPWQRVRPSATPKPAHTRVRVRREDFRIRRFVERTGTTVVFMVDASGSSALHRLAEAKGAVELLLTESYARRDRVCLLAFRGTGTELLLPPTRALARAKKVLAALPGGGGTPMAHAIDAALEQAIATKRSGSAPLVVFLTDGRANIARDGTPGRAQAEQDALQAGVRFAQQGIPALFVDTSTRGEPVARRIADSMRARYILLPAADAKALGGLVRTAMQIADGSP